MAINISVQYNGGLLPDIILLTQGYYQWGTRLNTMQWLCIYSLCNVSPLIASKTLHGILRMYYILYFLGYSSRVRVVLRCQYVHRTRKSSDFELQHEILRRTTSLLLPGHLCYALCLLVSAYCEKNNCCLCRFIHV